MMFFKMDKKKDLKFQSFFYGSESLNVHSKFLAFILPSDFPKTYNCKTKDYFGKTMQFILSTSWYKFV